MPFPASWHRFPVNTLAQLRGATSRPATLLSLPQAATVVLPRVLAPLHAQQGEHMSSSAASEDVVFGFEHLTYLRLITTMMA